jgi:hypothetical protein
MPIIGSVLLGFTYCDGRERESDIFRCLFIGYFFPGLHIVSTGNVILGLTMIQKRKNIKTLGNLINTRGYAPSYKSDNLVFRCSFYYLKSVFEKYNVSQVYLLFSILTEGGVSLFHHHTSYCRHCELLVSATLSQIYFFSSLLHTDLQYEIHKYMKLFNINTGEEMKEHLV